MPQATYIRGTKFSSYWFEIKEFVMGESHLWVVVGMEQDPADMALHEELIMKINSSFVGREEAGLAELMGLANFFEEKRGDKEMSYVMCLVEKDEMLVVGKRGGVYLLRGNRKGYVLKESEEIVAQKGKVKNEDKVFFGIGEGLEEIVSMISMEKKSKEMEEQLLKPCCGVLMDVDIEVEADVDEIDEVDEQMETKIDLIEEKKEENPALGGGKKSGVWKKWMGYLQTKTKTVNPEVYVKSDERKKLGRVVLLVFFLLIISVGVGWRKRKVDEKNEQFNQIYEPSLQLLIEAERQVEENALESREKLLEARAGLEQILNEFNGDDKEREKLTTLLSQVNDLYEKVSGEHKVSEASLFYDLSLIKEDVYGEEMSLADGWISVLDESRGVVLGVEEESKKGKLLAGGEILEGAKLLAASGGKAVVLSNSGLVGVYYNDRTAELLIETDESWKRPDGLGMFGGNVYVMDSETSEIWRYPGYEGGIGSGTRWLGPGVVPDFSNITGVAVDGDMWISYSNDIMRFRRGAVLNYYIEGLLDPFSKIEAIYTQIESEYIYVLDRDNGRVVVLNKEGEYIKQYIWEGIKAVSDMVVVEKDGGGGIILLLSGASIYEIPLE